MVQESRSRNDALDRGRESFDRRAWGDAYARLAAATRAGPLEPEDTERLAMAAHLVGRDAESTDIWARAHREFLNREDTEGAARCAFWLGFRLLFQGERARSGGWLARARRLLDEARRDSVVLGYLLLPAAIRRLEEGDGAGAHAVFGEAAEVGRRFGDTDLVTLARHGQGRALIRQNQLAAGVALLDEVMVAATAGELSPSIVGDVYCSVLEACHEICDLHRAQEWTAALSDWCASQPELIAHRGQCLVRRAELLQLHGAWPDAMDEAQRACERLSDQPGRLAAGAAFYQRAELHRLRGEFSKAEEAYRQAGQRGRPPQPGLSLLWLAQGRGDAALAAVCRAVDEPHDRQTRARVLGACVEIMLAANQVASARAAADELAEIAAGLDAPLLRALSTQAAGAVLLAEGAPRAALPALRRASTIWRELDAPFEAARVGVLLGQAHRELGDDDSADMETDAARQIFRRLGAAPDLARVETLPRAAAATRRGPLTTREVQVLRLVATGKTNRAIADDLVISEKTVARHVSNIFTKLALSTRAAATAYAYRHELV
jgi:DNA-binding CsgD family transcriptional regulator